MGYTAGCLRIHSGISREIVESKNSAATKEINLKVFSFPTYEEVFSPIWYCPYHFMFQG